MRNLHVWYIQIYIYGSKDELIVKYVHTNTATKYYNETFFTKIRKCIPLFILKKLNLGWTFRGTFDTQALLHNLHTVQSVRCVFV